MGHATHFLQRLDRVNDHEVELALALYRDDDLLKSVLASVELPASAERVAVSLGDPVRGPFVVLTREGRFVTCLEEGMHVSDLPVIPFERFEVAAGRVQRMRDELARIRQLLASGGSSQVKRLIKTMDSAGPRFCREDAELLGRVAPLIAFDITERVMWMVKGAIDALPQLAALRFDKLQPRERDYVLTFGQLAWSIAHSLPLIAVVETRQLWKKVGEKERAEVEYHFPSLTFEFFTLTHGHRALWTVARSGKGGLALARQPPRERERLGPRIFRELALGAIASASPSLRPQAEHKLTRKGEDRESHFGEIAEIVADRIRVYSLPQAEACVREYTKIGREHVQKLLRRNLSRAGNAVPNDALPAIPDDVARAAVANMQVSWTTDGELAKLDLMALGLPWLARAPLAELYLPRSWAAQLLPELSVEEVASWASPWTRILHKGRPKQVVREAPKVRRNAACSCGSGKKWKRCCALARA